MGDRAAVSMEEMADFGEGEAKCHMRNVHGHLAGERSRRGALSQPERGNRRWESGADATLD